MFILTATILLMGIVGFTIAYFTSSTDFENEFQTGLYQTEATETFTSPQNWLPGDTTPKELTITNKGNVDVKARVCIEETWEGANGDTLPNEVWGEKIAILNLTNTSDWTKHGKCYYYNDTLEPNDETSSFIESVTFNTNIEADIECTTTTSNGTTTKTCSSTGDGYDNATYTLTLRVETVQANKSDEVWDDYFKYVNKQNQNQITVGDEVRIGTEHFYIVSSNQNETVLLAKYNLLVGDVFDYDYDYDTENYTLVKTLSSGDTGYGLQNSSARGFIQFEENETTAQFVGTVGFSGTNYWDNSVCEYTGTDLICTGTTGFLEEYYAFEGQNPYVYRSNIGNTIVPQIVYHPTYGYGSAQNNGYTISYFVEQYKNKLIELGAPNTITGRLLSQEEAVSLGCSETDNWCSPVNILNSNSPTNGTAPRWVYNTSYWLGSANGSIDLWNVYSFGAFYKYGGFWNDNDYGVRPVIEIPTSELN